MIGNQLKTVLFLGLLTGLLVIVGGIIGGQQGLFFGLVIAIVMNFFSYWFSDKIVLAIYGAKELNESNAPDLHRIVNEVARLAEIQKPKLYLINDYSPNAFATGRSPSHSAIAVTTGLMQLLDEAELKGVIAHEVSHIKNYDVLISSVAAVIAGTIAYIAMMARWAAIFGGIGRRDDDRGMNVVELLAIAVVTPLIATLIRLAISRSREFLADATAAQTLHSYVPLMNALMKLESGVKARPMFHANSGTAHMFIVNPFSSEGLFKFFMTHPPIKERIQALQNLSF